MIIDFGRNSRTISSTLFFFFLTILFCLSACVVTAQREPYYTHGPSGPGHLHGIQGLWFLNAANATGKMELYWDRNALSGRIWFDAFRQWEPLTGIIFDPRTGELQFTRPNYSSRYVGTVSGDQLTGTFFYGGQTLPWQARKEPPRLGPETDFGRIIQGLWVLNAADQAGRMEFYWEGRAWSGRIWFDAFRQWEPLTDIILDPRTGELQFTRLNYGSRYIGTLSGDQLMGTFFYGGQTLSWEARKEPPRPGPGADFGRIQGSWFLNAANQTGKMEFHREGHAWSGRVWFDAFRQWEPLTDIIFDPRTGELQFTRPNYGSRYVGTLSGDQLTGTFTYAGQTLPWEARRH